MGADKAAGAVRVGPGKGVRLLVWGGFPVAGAVCGGVLWALADWLEELRWKPMRPLFKLLDALSEPVGLAGFAVLGVLAGGVVALLAESEYVTVDVSDDEVVCTRDGKARTLERQAISGVFVDDGRLVFLGHGAEELAVYSRREGADLPGAERLAAALQAHGYPWLPDGDPHRNEYRRWVPGLPGLPEGANELLQARERALRDGDKEEIAQLRGELARLGVVVRDDGNKRQFCRPARPRLDA
ncbi:YqeB family protein [Thermomonospora amylolytica]|uniref:YqeB family protein n=1 Tax=Thermomonospora amylolytica TaxID=1411117 RepID=UPI000E6C9A27|nr:hypothetical protein [Thermomonospora amylolytica]